jgi:ADP-ribose pyrophosphatase YjhB (NUDIX family)
MRSYHLVPRAIVVAGRHLLLVRDTTGIRAPSPARWHLPGGEVLAGETPQRAIERIVRLRTGLSVNVEGCLDAVAKRGADPSSGKPAPLLHLFFLCRPAPDAARSLLPADADETLPPDWQPDDCIPKEPVGPPGGADWGWTDLGSGIAALRHDVVGEWVVPYLQRLAVPLG